MEKVINNLKIYKEGSWCEVVNLNNGEMIFDGTVNEKASIEDIYTALTDEVQFFKGDKLLLSYNHFEEMLGERRETLKQLAYENNCNIEDIQVYLVNYKGEKFKL